MRGGWSEVRRQLRMWTCCWRQVCECRQPLRAGSEGPREANNFATDFLGSQSPDTMLACPGGDCPDRSHAQYTLLTLRSF